MVLLPLALVLTYRRSTTFFALALDTAVNADARAATVNASPALSIVLAQ